MSQIDLRDRDLSARELRSIVPRGDVDVSEALKVVEPILVAVRERGVEALREYALKFDGVELDHVRVPHEAIEAALATQDEAVLDALREAITRVRTFHEATVPPATEIEVAPGAKLAQRWVPVNRVGLYVPGGLAVYPSSVVMNVVAAQAAGVPEIAVTTPPQREFGGLPHPTILAACALLGITEVYAAGGAQSIAMLAYGVDDLCDPVDIITGPGNVYVAAAKRAVNGVVGIDAEAGPTEIAIIADITADAEYVAADLLSQAEHDPMAGSVLITDDEDLAERVETALLRRMDSTKHLARTKEALSGRQSAVILTSGIDQSVAVADAYGAEHLEIHTRDADAVAARITSAGAIFIGQYSPVPLGDYLAGSNHVLPTGGTARFASGLNSTSFLKAIQYITYSADALAEVGDKVVALANAENLPAHGEAIQARTRRGTDV